MCVSVRKAQESQKEMKLLLDMYKSAPKEQRDKVQLMAAERKSKAEVCTAIRLNSTTLFYPCIKYRYPCKQNRSLVNVVFLLQVDELRQRVRELEERERKESKKLADEDALRKLRVAEETIEHLQKKLTATKQVCLVLLHFLYTGFHQNWS